MKRRAAITGIGVISPLGIGKEANWDALEKGQCGISEICSFDASLLPLKAAGEVKSFTPEDYIANRKSIKFMNKCSQMAVAAAGMAVADSKIRLSEIDPARVGIYMGLGMISGNMDEIMPMLLASTDSEGEFCLKRFGSQGLSTLNPVSSFKVLNNFPLCHTSIAFNIQGPNLTFCSFASGSAQAVGEAFRAIQLGEVEIAFAGGSDSQISMSSFITLSQMGLLARNHRRSEEICRPFDVNRVGMVPGEGSSFIILEEMERALKRRAHIYGEIIGYGQGASTIAGYGYNTNASGCMLAIQKALSDGGIEPSDVGYINASADSHPVGDLTEARAIAEVFSNYAQEIPITSTKSMTGNLMAAAEPFEIIACIGVLERELIPPSLNFTEPDAGVSLNIINSPGHRKDVNIAMSNSSGFSGSCVSLVIRRFQQ